MNADFIQDLTATVARIEQTAREEFGALDVDQLNWSPGEDRWSVGHCLDHLMKANAPYFPIFENVENGTKQTTMWERLPLLPRLWGSFLLKSVSPDNKRKIPAPKVFMPSSEPVPPNTVESFCTQQNELSAQINSLKDLKIENIIITSPALKFVTYTLRNALEIIVTHEQRHLNQAKNVLAEMNQTIPK